MAGSVAVRATRTAPELSALRRGGRLIESKVRAEVDRAPYRPALTLARRCVAAVVMLAIVGGTLTCTPARMDGYA